MLTVTRKHTFAAAHRLNNYDGKCSQIHGHNYTVEVTVMVHGSLDVDFADIKKVCFAYLDRTWDHKLLLDTSDPLYPEFQKVCKDGAGLVGVPFNPTAENMAKQLYYEFGDRLKAAYGFSVQKIVVWETEKCWAEYGETPWP